MAWTTPRTWTTGDLLTASLFNTHIRDNFDYLKANEVIPPAQAGYVTANNTNAEQTLATTTIAAGDLGTTGACLGETWVQFTQSSGVAMNFTIRVKLGGTTFFAPVVSHNSTLYVIYHFVYAITNTGSASAQKAMLVQRYYNLASASSTTVSAWSANGVMYNTGTEATASACAFAVTGQMASAAATAYIYHLGTRLWAPVK